MSESILNFCSTCKHFKYVSNVAHQNQCTRFGPMLPVALVRPDAEKCNHGEKWEEAHAQT